MTTPQISNPLSKQFLIVDQLTAPLNNLPLHNHTALLIQELTIEMFQDDDEDLPTGSREHLVKAPPLTSSTPARESAYSGADDDELLAEAIGEERKGGPDSQTSLV